MRYLLKCFTNSVHTYKDISAIVEITPEMAKELLVLRKMAKPLFSMEHFFCVELFWHEGFSFHTIEGTRENDYRICPDDYEPPEDRYSIEPDNPTIRLDDYGVHWWSYLHYTESIWTAHIPWEKIEEILGDAGLEMGESAMMMPTDTPREKYTPKNDDGE